MRTLFLLLILGIPVVCREPIYFVETQPVGGSILPSFPAHFIGTYANYQKDSTQQIVIETILVDNTRLILESFSGEFHQDSLYKLTDEFTFRNDSAYDNHSKFVSVLERFGDSIRFTFPIHEIEFSINDSMQLKVFDNMCFLNYLKKERCYTDVMYFSGEKLIHASLSLKDESHKLSIALHGDTTQYPPLILAPSREELVSYIQSGGFTRRDTFERITK